MIHDEFYVVFYIPIMLKPRNLYRINNSAVSLTSRQRLRVKRTYQIDHNIIHGNGTAQMKSKRALITI